MFSKKRLFIFLIDVFKLSITAFGGPQMHYTQFIRLLVAKHGFINEAELKEINSLCSLLPGPTSTQTVTAIGYRLGGPKLAFLTLTIWVFPACLAMLAFAVMLSLFDLNNPKLDFLKYLQPMALGFIMYAAYQFKTFFISRPHHWFLMCLAAILAIFIASPYVFPVILFVGGLVSNQINKANYKDVKPIKNVNWNYLILFFAIFIITGLTGLITQNRAFLVFEHSYRFGGLVFGGGHVLIPMLFNQFVEFKNYLNNQTFLAGVGLLQGLPGPVFSIATFTGAMSFSEYGLVGICLGGLIGTIGIFLPGILMIFFVYPIWTQVKNSSPIKSAIEGINAASTGLVIASAYLIFEAVELSHDNVLVLISTLFILLLTKIPSPILVLICILAGALF